MSQSIEPIPASRSLLDMVERASLFALLQQALERQKQAQELPARLRDDVGLSVGHGDHVSPHLR